MKCPKCDYTSFDHNESCPKCGNALSSERKEMNLHPYKPEPPFLLGALVGSEDGNAGEREAQAPAESQAGQEELMANLDQLEAAYSKRDAPEEEELTFDLTDDATEAEEVKRDLGDDGNEAADIRTLDFDIEPQQPELDAVSLDTGSEKKQAHRKDASNEALETTSDDFKIETEPPEKPDTPVEFELDRALKEDEISSDSVWDTEALEKKMAEIEENAPATTKRSSSDNKAGEKTDEFVIELDEVEPLELEIDTDESDKKKR